MSYTNKSRKHIFIQYIMSRFKANIFINKSIFFFFIIKYGILYTHDDSKAF